MANLRERHSEEIGLGSDGCDEERVEPFLVRSETLVEREKQVLSGDRTVLVATSIGVFVSIGFSVASIVVILLKESDLNDDLSGVAVAEAVWSSIACAVAVCCLWVCSKKLEMEISGDVVQERSVVLRQDGRVRAARASFVLTLFLLPGYAILGLLVTVFWSEWGRMGDFSVRDRNLFAGAIWICVGAQASQLYGIVRLSYGSDAKSMSRGVLWCANVFLLLLSAALIASGTSQYDKVGTPPDRWLMRFAIVDGALLGIVGLAGLWLLAVVFSGSVGVGLGVHSHRISDLYLQSTSVPLQYLALYAVVMLVNFLLFICAIGWTSWWDTNKSSDSHPPRSGHAYRFDPGTRTGIASIVFSFFAGVNLLITHFAYSSLVNPRLASGLSWERIDLSSVSAAKRKQWEANVSFSTGTGHIGAWGGAAAFAMMELYDRATRASVFPSTDVVILRIFHEKCERESKEDGTVAFVLLTRIFRYDLTAFVPGCFGRLLAATIGPNGTFPLLYLKWGLVATQWPFHSGVFLAHKRAGPSNIPVRTVHEPIDFDAVAAAEAAAEKKRQQAEKKAAKAAAKKKGRKEASPAAISKAKLVLEECRGDLGAAVKAQASEIKALKKSGEKEGQKEAIEVLLHLKNLKEDAKAASKAKQHQQHNERQSSQHADARKPQKKPKTEQQVLDAEKAEAATKNVEMHKYLSEHFDAVDGEVESDPELDRQLMMRVLRCVVEFNDAEDRSSRCNVLMLPSLLTQLESQAYEGAGFLRAMVGPTTVCDLRRYKGKGYREFVRSLKKDKRRDHVKYFESKGGTVHIEESFASLSPTFAEDLFSCWSLIATKRVGAGEAATLITPSDAFFDVIDKELLPDFRSLMAFTLPDNVAHTLRAAAGEDVDCGDSNDNMGDSSLPPTSKEQSNNEGTDISVNVGRGNALCGSGIIFKFPECGLLTSDIQGLDHPIARPTRTYFAMMQRAIQMAHARGYSWVDFGPTTVEPKIHAGCRLVPCLNGLFTRNMLMRAALKYGAEKYNTGSREDDESRFRFDLSCFQHGVSIPKDVKFADSPPNAIGSIGTSAASADANMAS